MWIKCLAQWHNTWCLWGLNSLPINLKSNALPLHQSAPMALVRRKTAFGAGYQANHAVWSVFSSPELKTQEDFYRIGIGPSSVVFRVGIIITLKWHLLWSRWAKRDQISSEASILWGFKVCVFYENQPSSLVAVAT